MKVNVQYDNYNSKMVKAEIPTSEDSLFSIALDTETVATEHGDNGEAQEESTNVEKLVITGKDTISDSKIELSMDKVEVRELISLLNKFRNSMK